MPISTLTSKEAIPPIPVPQFPPFPDGTETFEGGAGDGATATFYSRLEPEMLPSSAQGFYRGFGTLLMGIIHARALYMGALEMTKSNLGSATLIMGFYEVKATAIVNVAAGLSAAMAAQLV